MLSKSEISVWLKQLLLEDSEAGDVHQGVQAVPGHGQPGQDGGGYVHHITPDFDHAQTMKLPRRERINHLETELVPCKIVENLKLSEDNMDLVDIETPALRLCHSITSRDRAATRWMTPS